MYRMLSEREKQVLTLLAQGRKNSEVAQFLGISQGAVGLYVSRAKSKLNLIEGENSTVALVLRAMDYGLIKRPVHSKMSAREAARKNL